MTLILFESLRPNPQESQTFFVDQPDKIIQCQSAAEIDDLLIEVQKWIQRGYTAFGFLTYEAGYAFLPNLPEPHRLTLPYAWFALSKDFQKQLPKTFIAEAKQPDIQQLHLNQDLKSYEQALTQIKKYIYRGDTYQVNYTLRYNGQYHGSPRDLYSWLRLQQRVNYAALIETSDWAVLSFSPELFFRKNGQEISMRPMKGTAARGRNLQEDVENAFKLRNSEKEKSENLMIVDLLRNDLGKICEPGSVQVTTSMDIEQYETLLQMTSTVTGILNSHTTTVDVFRATFPSGSVTGAPKIRTMQIIHELEKQGRGIYTGSIGWWSADQSVFSVAIRTIFLHRSNGNLEMGVGSGILYEADIEREYGECELKAKFLTEAKPKFKLIETIRWEQTSGYADLNLHLDRLERSAQYFWYHFDRDSVQKLLHLNEAEMQKNLQRARVRLLLDESGFTEIEWREFEIPQSPARISLSQTQMNSNDRFLYHKTTNRNLYDEELSNARAKGYFDVIFRNERDEITEGTISNIFIEKNGKLYTPPLNSGLLPGTFRQYILESPEWDAHEKILTMDDLRNADRIFLTNAIQGMLEVILN
jgi:para-aminobenzoate synthetase / 4-amino-4-deoxychorismate lyase